MNYREILQDVDLAITRIGGISSNWSVAQGHNVSEVSIMFVLMSKEIVTQKDICQMTAMPKQTVNNIIRSWQTEGYIELVTHPKDRRAKSIELTKIGENYIKQTLHPIFDMQSQIIEKMGEEQFLNFSKMLDTYYQLLLKAMMANLEEKEKDGKRN